MEPVVQKPQLSILLRLQYLASIPLLVLAQTLRNAGTPLTFTANNPSGSFNYFWVVQEDTLSGDPFSAIGNTTPSQANVTDTIITTMLVEDASTGCIVPVVDTIYTLSSPIISLDTSLTAWDSDNNGFIYDGTALSNGNLELEFYNSYSVMYDSLVINWGNGSDTTILTAFNNLYQDYDPLNNYQLSLTPYLNNCSYQTNYQILGSDVDTIQGGGLIFLSQTACSDSSTWFYLKDQNEVTITNIGPNDSIIWTIYCEYPTVLYQEIWTQNDLLLNTTVVPNTTNDSIPAFEYFFTENFVIVLHHFREMKSTMLQLN